ncbi:SH3 domain-containing protein [Clostridium sp. AF32-12BH]|uniref:SH3 domain-containing protein n=1 Tax=Clostridium sp. AF32-12BH TaxID=2292006 RepID=UPI000E4ADB0B|nr:SH3 domain-containing protein [Clostridium sp. AF32-12BH]RHP46460.1 peptide-binding protein [Clostridium sp. AF32-12BH]
MKKQTLKKGLAAVLGLALCVQMPSVNQLLQFSSYAQERSATINASSLNVRSGAGTSYSSIGKLGKGSAVTVVGEQAASDGKTWYQIRFTNGGTTQIGYVLSTYVKFPVSYSHDSGFESQLSAQGFPESYKTGLRQIHAQYPNWTFTAVKTGLDWNTVIQNEGVLGRNLVHTNSISSYKSLADGAYNWDSGTWTGFDGSTWVAASTEIISYYMDPRNFLDEVNVFQFLDQSYNSSLHTKDGLQSMLTGTFMEGNIRTGASASGSSSSGNNTSGSSSSSGSSNVITVGPGVSGGKTSGTTSSSPGTGSSGASAAAGTGNSGITSASPGSSSSGNSSQSSGTSSAPQVRLEGPSASITKNKAELVASSVVIGVAPGSAASGNAGSSSAANVSGSAQPSQTAGSPQTSGTSQAAQTPSSSGSQASSGVSYTDAIMSAAQSSGVSPYVIAAMIIQEQGRNGTGNSISGNYAGYTGYYNYFNVGAYASDGMGAVQRGLWYASQSGTYGRPWTTPESSIAGGAQFYGTNYVKAGQDTLYLKKYNVQGSNIYKHQYMTNVDGAASEGSIFAEGFTAKQKSTALNFKIPVYNNMPDTPCPQPTLSGSPNNKLNGLGVEGFTLTPTFNRDTYSYDLIVDHSVSNVTVSASAIDSKASVRGNGNVSLSSGINEISVVVRAENGAERTYTIHVVRQAGGPTYNSGLGSGISSGSSSVTVGGPGSSSAGTSGGSTSSGVITAGPSGTSSGQAAGASPNSGSSSGTGVVTFSSPGGN